MLNKDLISSIQSELPESSSIAISKCVKPVHFFYFVISFINFNFFINNLKKFYAIVTSINLACAKAKKNSKSPVKLCKLLSIYKKLYWKRFIQNCNAGKILKN